MHEEMARLLAEYEDACADEWRVSSTKRKAYEEMNRLCAKERRALLWRVKKIMKSARSNWYINHGGIDCRVVVDHRSPMKARISIGVSLNYCSGSQRMELGLRAYFDEMNELLENLRRTVTDTKEPNK